MLPNFYVNVDCVRVCECVAVEDDDWMEENKMNETDIYIEELCVVDATKPSGTRLDIHFPFSCSVLLVFLGFNWNQICYNTEDKKNNIWMNIRGTTLGDGINRKFVNKGSSGVCSLSMKELEKWTKWI